MKIGVLALQGDFIEHITILERIGIETKEVRLPDQLGDLDGLIIPGGESTAIGKLAVSFRLMEPLREFGTHRAIWGTCAGAIFLSRDAQRHQPLLGLMDIQIERNAFGRQIDSFEVELDVQELYTFGQGEKPFPALFIRAPLITSVGEKVKVLASLGAGKIVAAQQDHLLATSFHPELTQDPRFHQYFVALAKAAKKEGS